MTKRDILGKSFYEFEGRNFEHIKVLEIFGFNAWQIVKYPLYWKLIMQDENDERQAAGNGRLDSKYFKRLKSLANKITDVFQLCFALLKAYIKARLKKKLVLFHTYSVDKQAKNEQGAYINSLVDPFIINNIVTSYIYDESPYEGKYKTPAVISTDFRFGKLHALDFFFRMFLRHRVVIEELAGNLYDLLEDHFENEGITVKLSKEFLVETILYFHSEYKYSGLFLRAVRPKLIISSEQLGYGFLAAARRLSITSIDLQHGIIDRFHPQYIYTRQMRVIKDKLIIPSYLGVFGSLHKNVLLHDEFWSEQEIVVLGNDRIQSNRSRYTSENTRHTEENLILFPTQKTTFREMKTLLEEFLAMDKLKFKVIVKIHPLEPESNVEVYNALASQKPGFIEIAGRESNVYTEMMKTRLVVGFDSAVLLEAVSLLKPCVTLTTPSAPKGIHEFYLDGVLEGIIRPVKACDTALLVDLINRTIEDEVFYKKWAEELSGYSDNLYSGGYLRNCEEFIKRTFHEN